MTNSLPTDLKWVRKHLTWFTPLEDDQRFVISFEASPAVPLFKLEQVAYRPHNRFRRTVVRQLRSIESLDEAKRIAAEDWS